jgi:hypothetical protein
MSNFDNDPRTGANLGGLPRSGWSPSAWMGVAAAVVIVVLALGYVFSNQTTGAPGTIEHSAATSDAPSPATPPASPVATPVPAAPAATPKP